MRADDPFFNPNELTMSEKRYLLKEQYKRDMAVETDKRRKQAAYENELRLQNRAKLKRKWWLALMILAGSFLIMRIVFAIMDAQKDEIKATKVYMTRENCTEYVYESFWSNVYECTIPTQNMGECTYLATSNWEEVLWQCKENAHP